MAASEGERFARVVNEFTEKVRELGPLEFRGSIEDSLKNDNPVHEEHAGLGTGE